jgi:hypothetical protein
MPTLLQGSLTQITRREFLKLSGAALTALLLPQKVSSGIGAAFPSIELTPTTGRMTTNNVMVYDAPSLDARQLKTFWQDHVLPITQVTVGGAEPTHNRVWYEMNHEGWVHSGSVQPVEIVLNEPVLKVGEINRLAEVTVPFTDAIWSTRLPDRPASRLYYATTYWVTDVYTDDNGKVWYRILDDFYGFTYYVDARHLRLLLEEDVAPISPDVPLKDKKLEVRLEDQVVLAWEGDQVVFMSRASTGRKYSTGNFTTPRGRFYTRHKRPSRHMAFGNLANPNSYNLPGVPWICYITENGISFHGTFWHNDYGMPRSHGCINMSPQAACWVYRWTLPVVPFEKQVVYKEPATLVEIV